MNKLEWKLKYSSEKYSIIFVAWSGKLSFADSRDSKGFFFLLFHINNPSDWSGHAHIFVIGSFTEFGMLRKDANVFIFTSDQCTVNKLAMFCFFVVDIV